MAERDYETAPVSERLDLDNIIKGLCDDLAPLRAGKIGVNDAIARSLLAKQIFNGVRIYLTASKLLTGNAAPAEAKMLEKRE
jgi:hypothetical protein